VRGLRRARAGADKRNGFGDPSFLFGEMQERMVREIRGSDLDFLVWRLTPYKSGIESRHNEKIEI